VNEELEVGTTEPQAEWDSVTAERASETPAEPAAEAFKDAPAEESVATPEVAAVVEPEPAPADPLEALPPAVRERLAKMDRLEQQLMQQSNDMKSAIGRVAHIQKELDAAKHAASVAGKNAPSQAQIAVASKNPDKWDAMKADFPDWGDAIDELLNHRLAGLQQPAAANIDPAQVAQEMSQQVDALREESRKEIEEYKVELKHGDDWKAKINTQEFSAWFTAQDASTKELAASPKGSDAVKLLDMFDKAAAKPVTEVKNERTSRLQAAATQRPGQAPPPKTEDDMSPEELWAYMAKQRKSA
jgi:hypothetical protein